MPGEIAHARRDCSCQEILLIPGEIVYARRDCSGQERLLMPGEIAHARRDCLCQERLLMPGEVVLSFESSNKNFTSGETVMLTKMKNINNG